MTLDYELRSGWLYPGSKHDRFMLLHDEEVLLIDIGKCLHMNQVKVGNSFILFS
jgi:hypothetical protein